MKKLIPVGVVFAVLLVGALICSNSLMGVGATNNNTLANMANINMSEAMKAQARATEKSYVTIDHMNTNLLLVIIAGSIALIALAGSGYKIINLVAGLGSGHSVKALSSSTSAGSPAYITLDVDRARAYIKTLSPTQRLEMQNRLYVIESILQEYEMLQSSRSITRW